MRRRKAKVVWLPLTNANSVDAAGRSTWGFASVVLPPDNQAGDSSTLEVPVVIDGSGSAALDPTSTLADIHGSGYRLRRIVGKLFCFIAQQDISAENLWGVSAGFIIRRVKEDGASFAAASGAIRTNPADIENSMDPWIWQRSWLLSDGPTFAGVAGAVTPEQMAQLKGRGPTANFFGVSGGNADAAHVDQKTARIVGPEARLFLDVSATNILGNGNGAQTSLVIVYNFRVLASMMTQSGNRRNASR